MVVGRSKTHVDAPELLNAVKTDDLLEQLVPVLLAAWRLREPERPDILQSVLNVEVGRVVEDGHDVVAVGQLLAIGGTIGRVGHGAVGRDRDLVEIDLLVRGRCWRWTVGGDFGHVECAV